jgi:Ca2+/Na+ antiporter
MMIGLLIALLIIAILFLLVYGLVAITFNWRTIGRDYARETYAFVTVTSVWSAWEATDTGHVYWAMLSVLNAVLCLYLVIRYWNGHPNKNRHVRRTRNSSEIR